MRPLRRQPFNPNSTASQHANRQLTDRRQINEKLAEAFDANEFLRENVIQAIKKDCGTYDIGPEKAQQLRAIDPATTRPPRQG
ncbi:hypothetical protein TSOC_008660 [Tetrabaena socialis]|uniref:Uncharacterized protein n=1 Tax=Tetrabaena socialis TaxID=47790 RepID=A0A2J7ZXW7_9CHLO|nr:hypothetical protein TSOC_008660 [Tetrabaena socialis]|eukprot:PNH05111.1 hypothetical protein TSOC_008660 [Tetrabaena socialis]